MAYSTDEQRDRIEKSKLKAALAARGGSYIPSGTDLYPQQPVAGQKYVPANPGRTSLYGLGYATSAQGQVDETLGVHVPTSAPTGGSLWKGQKSGWGAGMRPEPSLVPPVQPDWSAAFAPKDGAAPAARTSGWGMMNPSNTPAAQPAVNPQRDMIEEKRRLAALRSDRMKILWDGDRGLDPEAKAARIAAIRGAGAQIENIEGANRPIPQAQDAEQIAGGKRELWSQGLSMAEAKMRALIPRVQAEQDPARRDALTSELTHYRTVAQAFTTRLQGPEQDYGTDPAIQAAVAGQQKSREMAERSRGKYEEKASDDAKRHLAAVTLSREIAAKRGALEGAGLDTAIAQTKQAGAEATIGADPKVIESNIKARQFQAAAAAAKAKTEAGAYEGGAPTAQGAAIDQQRRAAARSLAGIGSDAEYNHFITQATGHLNALGSLTDGDRALANFQAQTLPVLQQIAALDPDEAARIARDLIGRIPSNAVTPGDLLTGPLGTFGIMRKGVANRRFLAVHRALDEIARGAAGGGLAQ